MPSALPLRFEEVPRCAHFVLGAERWCFRQSLLCEKTPCATTSVPEATIWANTRFSDSSPSSSARCSLGSWPSAAASLMSAPTSSSIGSKESPASALPRTFTSCPASIRTSRFAPGRCGETGVGPSFALKVVGDDITKDYEDDPALYDDLGVEELVVFDPHATATSRTRLRFQVFRRLNRRGLIRVEATQGDRVRSKVLGARVRAVGHHDAVRLRVALGDEGEALYPTEAESERAAKEFERAAKESERAAKESERAGRIAAEAEVARLRALLAKAKR